MEIKINSVAYNNNKIIVYYNENKIFTIDEKKIKGPVNYNTLTDLIKMETKK